MIDAGSRRTYSRFCASSRSYLTARRRRQGYGGVVVGFGPVSEVGVPTDVTVARSDGSVETVEIVLVEDYSDPIFPVGVRLSSSAFGDFQGWSLDYFEALRQVRRDLDHLGVLVLVNGARVDAWPSGLQSQQKGGRGLYLTGSPDALERGQVRLLDPAELSEVGTVQEQDIAHERWVNRLERDYRKP